jgi:phosphate transport system substrate-binding protein
MEKIEKIKYSVWLAILGVVGLWLIGAAPVGAEDILRINGSTTVQKNVIEPKQAALKQATGISLTVVGSGSVKGLIELVEEKCDLSMSSDSFDDLIKQAQKQKAGLALPDNLKAHVVARDLLAAITHPTNKVEKLTKDQLKGMITGKVTNWKEVGGSDAPVIVVICPPTSGTRGVVQSIILDGQPYAGDAQVAESDKKQVDDVAAIEGSICVLSEKIAKLPENKGKIKLLGTPEFARELLIITKGAPTPAMQKMIDFLKK